MQYNISVFIQEAGMSTRPEFYSGRGAISCDLSPLHLQKIHAAIRKTVGPDAATQFVVMVDSLPKLSATDFLLACQQFQYNDWKWDESMTPKSNGIHATDYGSGMGTIFSVMGGMSRRDETASIKASLIRENRPELEAIGYKPKRDQDAFAYGSGRHARY